MCKMYTLRNRAFTLPLSYNFCPGKTPASFWSAAARLFLGCVSPRHRPPAATSIYVERWEYILELCGGFVSGDGRPIILLGTIKPNFDHQRAFEERNGYHYYLVLQLIPFLFSHVQVIEVVKQLIHIYLRSFIIISCLFCTRLSSSKNVN